MCRGPQFMRFSPHCMESRPLGSTPVGLPVIGFGSWNYTGGAAPLRAGIEHGACFIDTAETYGTEEIIGEAIRDVRNNVFLATKVRPANFRARDVIAAAERSLKHLKTDFIDLYQLHWRSYTVPLEETLGAMERLVEDGKIRFIGVCNFTVPDLKRAQETLTRHKVVSNQVRYSLIERTIETGLLSFCRQERITIIAFSPLGERFSSLLAGDPEGTLAMVASRTGKTPAQVALNWVIGNENVVAIPKASSVAHAVEDCGASGWRLAQPDCELLGRKIAFKRRGPVEVFARRRVKHVLQLFGKALL
jgi:diketogulonate reductase-like aldo/keto reductase